MDACPYRVQFANGQVTICGSWVQARRVIRRRAENAPPPPGILPAVIEEIDEAAPGGLRLIERYPSE